MSYLTSHRSTARAKYGMTGNGLSNLPRPYTAPKPGNAGANDNAPRPANRNTPPGPKKVPYGKALARFTPIGRALIRRTPWLSAALVGLDYWRFINGRSQQGVGQIDYAAGGWTIQATCASQPPTAVTYESFGFTTGCFTHQFGGSGMLPLEGLPRPNHIGALFQKFDGTYQAGSPMFDVSARALRPANSPRRPIQPRFRIEPKAQPKLDPSLLPIEWVMPLPLSLPWSLLPYRVSDPLGSAWSNTHVLGARHTRGSLPYHGPVRQPPKGDEREVKLRANGVTAIRVLQKLAHAGTEAVDYIDSFHEALPKSVQAKPVFKGGKWWKASPQAKVEAVLKNFDALDWNDVVKNLIKNEIEDRILGRSNAGANRELSRMGAIRGIAF